MTNEELESVYERAELHYEQLKDSCHDLFEENKRLKEEKKQVLEYIDQCIDFVIDDKEEKGRLKYIKRLLGDSNE